MTPTKKIRHPEYIANYPFWEKYRYCWLGGAVFIERFLQKLSLRESSEDFAERKKVTYAPTHAKAALLDIRNAIYQRMFEIARSGGTANYQDVILGGDGGVDLQQSDMNYFIGQEVLTELLIQGKVGVCVDREADADNRFNHPYLYVYKAEDILSWNYDTKNNLTELYLKHNAYQTDDEYNLLATDKVTYKYYQLLSPGNIKYTLFDNEEQKISEATLNLQQIPFVEFRIRQSLFTDIADYQIALLNLASADMSYALKSNYPFYVEESNPFNDAGALLKGAKEPGDSPPNTSTIKVGVAQGRRYPKGAQQPAFIHPSSEPIKASMEKQEQLKTEIRQLVNLALTNIQPQRASRESKEFDNQGLEAGLAAIGLILERGERRIATIWADYEEADDTASIQYPTNYSLRTEADRQREAKEITDLIRRIPSLTFQKELVKRIAYLTLGHKIDNNILSTIYTEIDDTPIIDVDPDNIIQDLENGLVSEKTASKLRGYADGEVEQAKKDHAERAARIALAQSQANQAAVSKVGGVPDTDPNPTEPQNPDKGKGGN